jgi:hypothetical protein
MPERDYGPPPGLTPEALSVWAVKQIETGTCEGEIRAAVRVLMRGPNEPHRAFILYLRRRLLEVGAKLPHDLRA